MESVVSSFPQVSVLSTTTYVTSNFSQQEADDVARVEERERPGTSQSQWQAMNIMQPEMKLAIGVLMSLVGIAGTTGNFVIITLLLRCKKLQTYSNMCVANLALADLLMCFGNFPVLILSAFSGRWVAGYTGCKVYSFIGGLSGFVSINVLSAMACDRYSVIYNYKGLQRTEWSQQSKGVIVSLWIYSFLWALPPFFGWGQFALDRGQMSCCFDYYSRNASNASYIIAIFIFCFGIQILVIFFCYIHVIVAVYHQEKIFKHDNMDMLLAESDVFQNSQHRRRLASTYGINAALISEEERNALARKAAIKHRKKQEKKGCRRRKVEVRVTRLVCFITFSFCLSWIPFAVVSLLGLFGDVSLLTPLVSVVPGILAKIATVVNPILYAIGHPQCRKAMLKHYCGSTGSGRRRTLLKGKRRKGMLSSFYFASILKRTGHADSAAKETAFQLKEPAGNIPFV